MITKTQTDKTIYLQKAFYLNPACADPFLALQEQVFPGLDLTWALGHSRLADFSIPYGFFQDGKALSILNATPLTVLFGENRFRAVQIGTVATDPDWRGQGLSGQLLRQALDDYQPQVDLFFLFAHKQVLNFYPRFGFVPVTESRFEMACKDGESPLRQLNLRESLDRELLQEYLNSTTPVSARFGIENYQALSHFALNKFMPTCVWFDEMAEVLLVTAVEQNKMIIYDLIGRYFPENYLQQLVWPGAHILETRFSPDLFHGDFKITPFRDEEDQLFVYLCRENRVLEEALAGQFRVPALAKT